MIKVMYEKYKKFMMFLLKDLKYVVSSSLSR